MMGDALLVPAAPDGSPPQARPYSFRRLPLVAPSLYDQAVRCLLRRWSPTHSDKYKELVTKKDQQKAKRELTKYFQDLPHPVKADLMAYLFNNKWKTYRQIHRLYRTGLDKDMMENELCCTYPEECTGRHEFEPKISRSEIVLLWKILQGEKNADLTLLPFMDNYHHNVLMENTLIFHLSDKMPTPDNLLKDIESTLTRSTKVVKEVERVRIIGAFSGQNAEVWSKLFNSMSKLQSIELHFWTGESFILVIKQCCKDLRELILYRQRQNRSSPSDLDDLPALISQFSHSLRVLIVDNSEKVFSCELSRNLQKVISGVENLMCLKLEAEESPYVHWENSRYMINTAKLSLTLKRSGPYMKVIRNINRCFNSDVTIELLYDTYVDLDNHKHSYISVTLPFEGGENSVSPTTRAFEANEVSTKFWKLMSEFGPKVKWLSAETDIRPEYFFTLFPKLDYLEMFSRASRKVPVDPRFKKNELKGLVHFAVEADPGFTAVTGEHLLVHIIGDVCAAAPNLQELKVIAPQSALRTVEQSLISTLEKVEHNLQNLIKIEFLSPYCLTNSGLTADLAKWFLEHCPKLNLLRDTSSWTGSSEKWRSVAEAAKKRGLQTGWAKKTSQVALYTIDCDAESWVQTDTGHKFELYQNLNDDMDENEVGGLNFGLLEGGLLAMIVPQN